jgi:probable F420-dependent oxidoreductase
VRAVGTRAFRFGVSGQRFTRAEWRDFARKAEDLGYSTLLLPDHFGPWISPLPALLAAADATTRLRVGTLVLDNDFRHPLVLARDAAAIDLMTDGRFELGIGAGWMVADYQHSGIRFDPPAVRVARLAESVQILTQFLEGHRVSFSGDHYQVEDLEALPQPIQRPRLPILIGASQPRMLRLAARYADIVGLEDKQFAQRASGTEVTPARAADQVAIVRAAAGDRFGRLELNLLVARVKVTDDQHSALDQQAAQTGLSREAILESASFLLGSVDYMVERLRAQREQLGISYLVVFDRAMDAFAPVVARLAGT